jgi:hypothetical protein
MRALRFGGLGFGVSLVFGVWCLKVGVYLRFHHIITSWLARYEPLISNLDEMSDYLLDLILRCWYLGSAYESFRGFNQRLD